MSDEITKNFKKIAREAETGIARSLLRWRYRKEGKQPPGEAELQRHSRQVAEEAHRVMVKGGKTAWKELKKVYAKGRSKEEEADS
ncbi:MAG: hypothetical protein JRK53_22930 [Deltaproteobacteria bacterium]|nr:hypothetical protein [Deltaproteobacteria bacterium]MBW1817821.1 hypothetical protein [Deltaproteobacteria bacterium]MBW2285856.1 hypothetical protein [Deltaproteobacteria bacterium]